MNLYCYENKKSHNERTLFCHVGRSEGRKKKIKIIPKLAMILIVDV
jgi:hypothetical protein